MKKIAIVDYGMGNLHSVKKALERSAPKSQIVVTSSSSEIDESDKIVLPGVGAIGDCVKALRDSNLDKAIINNVGSKPLLAICVGMQLLLDCSQENNLTQGLGLIKGNVKKFRRDKENLDIKIPHMGWNTVKQSKKHFMWSGIPDDSYFYFVHSYACELLDSTQGISQHGIDFSAAIAGRNIFGVQFHPEKSQQIGLKIYENFSKWEGDKS
tara:strand:+ start:2104 stop:2736 length:633 start_codon:yes stop_codon:yes gene_type:complete